MVKITRRGKHPAYLALQFLVEYLFLYKKNNSVSVHSFLCGDVKTILQYMYDDINEKFFSVSFPLVFLLHSTHTQSHPSLFGHIDQTKLQ